MLPDRGDNAGMPRTARADLGGYGYHALNRGNGRARVFHDADDYHGFVRLLWQACARLPMRLVAFCLLPNHFHLVLWPRADDQVGPWMQWLLTAPGHGYRQRYGGSGHVWQGRFRAFPVEQDDHLLAVLRYVERNPLRAGLVERAEGWPWSSLSLWHLPPLCPWLGAGPVPRPPDWLAQVQAVQTEGELAAVQRSVQRGAPRRLGREDGKGVGPGIESTPRRPAAPGRVVGTRAWRAFQ